MIHFIGQELVIIELKFVCTLSDFSFVSSDGYVKVLKHDTFGGEQFSGCVVLENFDIKISTNFYMYIR